MSTQANAAAPQYETHSWTGSGVGRYNEDYALMDADARCAVLLDGATGLTKINLVAGESDAAWYARTLCHLLAAELADASTPTVDALVQGGQAAAHAYRQFEGAKDLERIDEPNGSLVVVRWTHETLEVTSLGDCTTVVGLRDGSWQVIYDDTLTQLDELNYARMYDYATSQGCTMAEARKALNPRFIENRLKMNEPGGYWAADISCRGMTHATSQRFARSEVRTVFACTDGYDAAVGMGVCPTREALAARVASGEGVQVGEELRAAELADAGCWEHPRSKTSDDATYLHLCFCDESAPEPAGQDATS